jgi:tRNA dimethylallyltransferase
MAKKPILYVIGGPTASGKTAAAISLAQKFDTEILSADSRQFYQEMTIGTAKPTAEELAKVPHHFINSLTINQLYTAGDFERDALGVLNDIFSKRETAILVGGSGLFIRAVCDGFDDIPPVSELIRVDLQAQFDAEGIGFLQKKIKELDPKTAANMDLENGMRLLRFVGVCLSSGQPYSDFLEKTKFARPFDIQYYKMEWPRAKLYARIDARVEAMIAAGLENEVQNLIPYKNLQALQTVGYSEFFNYFDGKSSLPQCIELIKQHSRNYAKRQETWFRKGGFWRPFSELEHR